MKERLFSATIALFVFIMIVMAICSFPDKDIPVSVPVLDPVYNTDSIKSYDHVFKGCEYILFVYGDKMAAIHKENCINH